MFLPMLLVLLLAAAVPAQSRTFTDPGKTFRFDYPVMASLVVVGGDGISRSDWYRGSSGPGTWLASAQLFYAFQRNTNFANAFFTLGSSADPQGVANCLEMSNGSSGAKSVATINGVTFTKYVYHNDGAGHLHEIHSYRTVRNQRCYALEYDIHWLNYGNFGPGSPLVPFDQAKVEDVFSGMVLSFRFL